MGKNWIVSKGVSTLDFPPICGIYMFLFAKAEKSASFKPTLNVWRIFWKGFLSQKSYQWV